MNMRLRLLLPDEVFLDEQVVKIVAEGHDGWFCLLPKHRDLASVLPPSVLIYETYDRGEHYVATDEAILVKSGLSVTVATRLAVRGESLGELRSLVERQIMVVDEKERAARSAIARLEAGFVRRFLDFEKRGV